MIDILYNAERREPYKHISNMHQKALDLVDIYFKDKKDKGGNDYRNHLWDVARNLGEYASKQCKDKYSSLGIYYNKAFIVALLHDLFEDTSVDAEMLIAAGIDDPEVISAIAALTKMKNERYIDYIKRVYLNDIARLVKIFDLENNMDIRRLPTFNEKDIKRTKKYWFCWKFLKDELDIETVEANLYKQKMDP